MLAAFQHQGHLSMDIQGFFGRDRFAAHSGVSLMEVSPGFARARLEVGPQHLNAVGIVQGGAVFTLADFAFAACCNSRGTEVAVAVSANISFAKATTDGVLHAEARELALSRRLSTCEIRVTDDAGELVALFTGTAYRKNQTLAELEKLSGG